MPIDIAAPGADEAALANAVRNLVQVRLPMRSGSFYQLTDGPLQSVTPVTAADGVIAFPFHVGKDTDVDNVFLFADNITDDPSNALFAIYSDDSGRPGSPVLQSGVVDIYAAWDTAANGTVPLGISGVIPAGWNWFAACAPTYAVDPQLLSIAAPLPDTYLSYQSTQFYVGSATAILPYTVARPTWAAALTFAGLTELPDPFPAGGAPNSAPPLAVVIGIA